MTPVLGCYPSGQKQICRDCCFSNPAPACHFGLMCSYIFSVSMAKVWGDWFVLYCCAVENPLNIWWTFFPLPVLSSPLKYCHFIMGSLKHLLSFFLFPVFALTLSCQGTFQETTLQKRFIYFKYIFEFQGGTGHEELIWKWALQLQESLAFLRNNKETFKAQITEMLQNIEPTLLDVFLV